MSDALGWIAAGLTVATFSCKQPVALRLCALAANAAFICYGAIAGLWPVLVLHAVLLPINAIRLMQAQSQAARGRERSQKAAASARLVAEPDAATQE